MEENKAINNVDDLMNVTMESLDEFDLNAIPEGTPEQYKESAINTLKVEYNIPDSDIMKILELIDRRKNKEDFDILEELPQSLKSNILKLCAANNITSKSVMKSFAEDLLDNIIQDSTMSVEIDNFNVALKDAMKTADILSVYTEHTKSYFEDTLLPKAEELKNSENEAARKQSEKIFKLYDIYTSSYTYDEVKKAFLSDRKMRNRTIQDLREVKKYCLNYDRAMKQYTTLTVTPAYSTVLVLRSIFGNDTDIDNDLIDKFVVVLMKYVDRYLKISMSDENIFDTIRAYYLTLFINNLINFTEESGTDFEKTIVSNIKDFMMLIKKTEEEHMMKK